MSNDRGAISSHPRRPWIPVALTVCSVGWGTNQFAPLLLLYQSRLHLTTAIVEATFAVYAVGLIPGFLIGGPLSDRWGRRRVVYPTALLSLVATVILMFGGKGSWYLFTGRFLAGVTSGTAFAAGSAWLKELSAAPYETPPPGAAARRAVVAMTLGFGFGPLVAGMLAQWAPAPTVVPYVPHLVLGLVALAVMLRAPEIKVSGDKVSLYEQFRVRSSLDPRFVRRVLPMAPWVVGLATLGFAYQPTLVARHSHAVTFLFSAVVTCLTALSGVLAQPLARRFEDRGTTTVIRLGMTVGVVGLLVGAFAAAMASLWLMVVSVVALGTGYGICIVAGLNEVQRVAPATELASLTSVYYALTYIGYGAPYALAALGDIATPAMLLLCTAAIAVLCMVVATTGRPNPAARVTPPAPEASD
jgi:MFS family permease